jgi:hypothetical protein
VERYPHIVTSFDKENECQVYEVVNGDIDDNGNLILGREMRKGEKIHLNKIVYGYSFFDMDVDFQKKEVSVSIEVHKPFLNTVLLGTDKNPQRVRILPGNKSFVNLINHVNVDILTMKKLCISESNIVVYGSKE